MKRENIILDIDAQDRLGLLAQILNLIADAKINVKAINTSDKKGNIRISISLESSDTENIKSISEKIGKIQSILNVGFHHKKE